MGRRVVSSSCVKKDLTHWNNTPLRSLILNDGSSLSVNNTDFLGTYLLMVEMSFMVFIL